MEHNLVNFLPHSMAVMDKQSYNKMQEVMGKNELRENSFITNVTKAQHCVYLLKNFVSLSIVRNLTPFDPPSMCEILIFCANKDKIELLDFSIFKKKLLSNKDFFPKVFSTAEKIKIIENAYEQYEAINEGGADPFKIDLSYLNSLVGVFKSDSLYRETPNSSFNTYLPYFNAIEGNRLIDFTNLNSLIPPENEAEESKAIYFLNYAIQEQYSHLSELLKVPKIITSFKKNKDEIIEKLIYLADLNAMEQLIEVKAIKELDIKNQIAKIMNTTAMINYKPQIESCWLKFNLEVSKEAFPHKQKSGI